MRRRALFRRPVRNPFSVAIDLLTDMRREFDQHPSPRHLQDLHACLDDAVRELEPVLAGAAGAKFDENHHDRFKAVGAEVKEIVLAKLGDADIRPPALRLHDVGIETAKPNGKLTLLSGRKPTRQIKMKIWHDFLPAGM